MQFKSYACECKNKEDSHAAFRPVIQPHRIIRWPKRVNHKSVYYNTKQFHKTQISLPKHNTISQNTNQFTNAKHKLVYQNTKQLLKTQISLPKHKSFLKTQTNFASHKSKDDAPARETHSQDFPRPIWRLFHRVTS